MSTAADSNVPPLEWADTADADSLATPAPDRDEGARVRAWRVERLAALIDPGALRGIDPFAEADALAEHLADARGEDGFPVCLHAFERLTAAGCPPNVAADLLAADLLPCVL